MGDPQRLREQFLGGNQPERGGLSPDLLKGAAMGGLAGLLLGSKSGRKLGKSALQLGTVAALGGLAWKAYNDWKASAAAPGSPRVVPPRPAGDVSREAAGTVFLPAQKSERDTLSLTLLRAMIAAAKADGHLDAQEQRRIFAKIGELALDSEDKAFLMDELRAPLDIDAVVRGCTPKHRQPQAAAPAKPVGKEWDRGCADAKGGSYDRSKHSQAYEDGWQACKQK